MIELRPAEPGVRREPDPQLAVDQRVASDLTAYVGADDVDPTQRGAVVEQALAKEHGDPLAYMDVTIVDLHGKLVTIEEPRRGREEVLLLHAHR